MHSEGFPIAFLFFFGQTMNCVPQPFGLDFLYKKCTMKQLSELFLWNLKWSFKNDLIILGNQNILIVKWNSLQFSSNKVHYQTPENYQHNYNMIQKYQMTVLCIDQTEVNQPNMLQVL